MDNVFSTIFGTVKLEYSQPEESNTDRSLRAWDAADEYILSSLGEYDLSSVLIINDFRGGLCCPLTGKDRTREISVFSDSLVSEKMITANCGLNELPCPELITESFPGNLKKLSGKITLIIIKIPKSLEYFDYLMKIISIQLPPNIPVIAGGMARHLPESFFTCFSGHTRESKYSLIKKRARIYQGTLPTEKENKDSLITDRADHIKENSGYTILDGDLEIINYPGVFAYGRIDPGTGFLIETMNEISGSICPERIADPGCGDGALSIAAASLWPGSLITATDESFQAILSAGESVRKNGFEKRIEVKRADILSGLGKTWADLVLCNPPFHGGTRTTTGLPFRFIKESSEILKPGGIMFLVANRHLGYLNTMKKYFTRAEIFRENRKFRIYKCWR